MTRDLMDITYTHDAGVVIKINMYSQKVFFSEERVRGPFEPFDVDTTCQAITEEAQETECWDWLKVASSWRQLNLETDEDMFDEDGNYTNTHGWTWK